MILTARSSHRAFTTIPGTIVTVAGVAVLALCLAACGPSQPQPHGRPGQPTGLGAPPEEPADAGREAEPAAEEPADWQQAAGPAAQPGGPGRELVGTRLEPIYFSFDRSDVRPDQRSTMEANAAWLRQNPGVRLLVEGHCDERGTREYNLALGDRRAESARRYLVSLGIEPTRIDTVSYGEERPADPGHNEVAWARNRRAEFVVVEG